MAVPIGPIGVLCVRKTLTEGRLSGLTVGAGAATADLIYGCVAAFGLTVISSALARQRLWIGLAGGALLFFLGLRTFLARPAKPKFDISGSGMIRSYFTTVALTLTNPLTIFAFLAVFAALGLATHLGVFSASTLVTGVFLGSCSWFLVLSSGAALFKKKLDFTGLRWVNRVAGGLTILSGVVLLVTLL